MIRKNVIAQLRIFVDPTRELCFGGINCSKHCESKLSELVLNLFDTICIRLSGGMCYLGEDHGRARPVICGIVGIRPQIASI